MHRAGIAHRDLKPENTLLANTNQNFGSVEWEAGGEATWHTVNKVPRPVLIDFGFSDVATKSEEGGPWLWDGRSYKRAGSSHYVAPEVFLRYSAQDPPADSLDRRFWDMWSFAVFS